MGDPNASDSGVHHRSAATTEANGTCGADEVLDNVMGVEDEYDPTQTVPATKKSGIFGASSNLVNSIVGAGIIGIPYAMKQSGLIAGVLLLILVAYMTGEC